MDAKALAKSKRAHSLHHSKKSHSAHKPKVTPESSGSARNLKKLQGSPAAAQNAKTPIQSKRLSALPSNWDRYDEEFNLGLESSTLGDLSADQHIDVIIPKSKGADYCHLIAEAEAESQSKMNIVSDDLSSLDDVLQDEFSCWLVRSMLSARGEGILSWIEDDNFIVEDRLASNHEPAFLSLNLNALAEALEKVDLPEALYVEADILPPELLSCKQGHRHRQSQPTQETKAIPTVRNEPAQPDICGKGMGEMLESINNLEDDYLSAAPTTNTVDQVKDIPIITGQSKRPSNTLAVVRSSAFEAELDMLLDSFGETGVHEAENKPHSVRSSTLLDAGSSDRKIHLAATSRDAFEKSSTFQGTSAEAEAELDTLLNSYGASTSSLGDSAKGTTSPSDQKLHTARFDDVLDDLLEQTSDAAKPQQNQTTSSSSSVRKSEVLDEFDSWLDTI